MSITLHSFFFFFFILSLFLCFFVCFHSLFKHMNISNIQVWYNQQHSLNIKKAFLIGCFCLIFKQFVQCFLSLFLSLFLCLSLSFSFVLLCLTMIVQVIQNVLFCFVFGFFSFLLFSFLSNVSINV